MEQVRIRFGKRVKELRRARQFTQAQLAEKTNFSVNYISDIETGKASPSFEAIVALADALATDIKSLFDFQDSNEG